MNNLDKQYTDLLQDILNNGVTKSDRTGTGTLSVFGRQIRHKMSEGFPLLTTKKMPFKTIVTELLWFLRGDTNIKFLVDNDCHIWDGDAYQNYLKNRDRFSNKDNVKEDVVINGMNGSSNRTYTQEEFINKIKTDDEFAKKWGELGPIYGKQWRRWNGKVSKYRDSLDKKGIEFGYSKIDQIANLIRDLKTNPDSRRLMVNAWNVGELDSMVLPPCHYGFQVYTRELEPRERLRISTNYGNIHDIGANWDVSHKLIDDMCDEWGVPKRAISLMWNQRSVDTFLGLPFNITSYGLLLEIIAKEVNMVPDELIGNLGDTHLYLNHIEQAKEQIGRELSKEERIELAFKSIESTDGNSAALLWELSCQGKNESEIIESLNNSPRNIPTRTREPYPLPKLIIDQFDETNHYIGDIDDISEYNIEQFKLENYQSHPSIKAPLSN